ncbi:MAG: hypothetical protein JWP63_4438, partial [Candidatus Solibacter sp.]|nr:hypothetical protein [Candidatus Solibacter sp.]
MLRHRHLAFLTVAIVSYAATGFAADTDRDFSGKWTLDPAASRVGALGMQVDTVLIVVQQLDSIRLSNQANYALDGSATRYRSGSESHSSAVKWEGAALLINTLVSGAQDYTVMDRWRLSDNHMTLTVTRQVIRGTQQSEGTLVYRAEGFSPAPPGPPEMPRRAIPVRPPVTGEVIVPEGTRIALSLRNAIDTKHSREGDRVYLETVYPVARDGYMVIPRGSFVNGTVTISKAAGRGKGKGELYIRFDALTLPNGVTRDFRSRLGSAEGKTVDRTEGTIKGERDKGHDARTVATTTGMGASLGGLIGRASGSTLKGVGVGGAAGAAAGLAGVLMKKGPDATLRPG